MKVFNRYVDVPIGVRSVVTIGTFDGVHLGHKKLLYRLREIADTFDGETMLLTFNPHPRAVLQPEARQPKLLNTLEEKCVLLEKAGVDNLVIQPFSREFSLLSAEEFIQEVLVKGLHVRSLVIGYDHRFGKDREGNFKQLQQFGKKFDFMVEEIEAKDIDKVNVSSTKIRQALLGGDIATAYKYLGYQYMLSGRVVKGQQLGRTLGYPTANIELMNEAKLVPADGVYAVKVDVGGATYKGMLSIGENPTINGKGRSVEVNIFDFDKDIYGEQITVSFYARLRNEEKYDTLEALKEQLAKDKDQAMTILNEEE